MDEFNATKHLIGMDLKPEQERKGEREVMS